MSNETAPITTATTAITLQPSAPVHNPLLAGENWAPLLALIAAVALIVGLMTRHITGKIGDYKDAHKPVHDALDIVLAEMKHKLANERSRTDQLERFRIADVERIVRVETNMLSLEKGQLRIEHALEVMKADSAEARAEIVQTIREMSKRELK